METGQNDEVINGRESRVLKSFVKFQNSILRSYLWWVSLGTFDNITKFLSNTIPQFESLTFLGIKWFLAAMLTFVSWRNYFSVQL